VFIRTYSLQATKFSAPSNKLADIQVLALSSQPPTWQLAARKSGVIVTLPETGLSNA